MTRRASPKKSETLEVRLPHAAKSAFMARCRDEGRTASEAVRLFIEGEVGRTPARRMLGGWRQALAAAAIGLALGAVAAPSIAQTAAGSRAGFDQLDRNRDGVITFEEYARR